jgi:RHS repeat-associated protein
MERGGPGTRYEYQGDGTLLIAAVSSDGERVEYRYQRARRILEVTRVADGSPTHRFDFIAPTSRTSYRTVYTNPLGGRTRYEFDRERRLRVVTLIDTGEVSTTQWRGRRPSRHIDAAGVVCEFEHEDDLLAVSRESSGNEVLYTYQPGGLNLTDPTRAPIRRIEDSLGIVEEREYDSQGRVARVRNGEGDVVAFEYAGSSVASITRSGRTISYPSFGIHGHWLEAMSDGKTLDRRAFTSVGDATIPSVARNDGGHLSRFYDSNRRLVSIDLADVDEIGDVTSKNSVTIDRRSDGKPVAIRRPGGGDHEFVYDGRGLAVSIRERVDGSWQETKIEYDLVGNESARQLPNGMREEFGRDLYGRIVAHRAFRFGILEGEATFSYLDGRLSQRFDSIRGSTEYFGYDSAGRHVATLFGFGEVETREYDLRNRVVRQTYALAGQNVVVDIGVRYDLADRIIEVADLSAGTTWVVNEFVDGLLRSETFGNGLRRDYAYDTSNRVERMETWSESGELVELTEIQRSFEFDPPRVQVHNRVDTSLGNTEERYALRGGMSLVDLNELAGKRIIRWDDGASREIRFAWDGLSNRIDDSVGNTFVYNEERNRLVSATLDHTGGRITYAYDEAGFATARSGVPIEWSATGRITRFGDATAEWDMMDRLVAFSVASERREFQLFGGRIESTFDSLGAIDLGIVSVQSGTGEAVYRHKDFRGNVSFVSDATGQIISQFRYSPYGVDRVIGSGEESRRFEGQLEFSGFVLMGARVYDPSTGRFLSPDPALQWTNQYAYTLGNPLYFHDTDGKEWTGRTALSLGVGVAILGAGLLAAAAIIATGPVGVVTIVHVAQAAAAAGAITAGAAQVAEALAEGAESPSGGEATPPPAPPASPAPAPAPSPPGSGGSGNGFIEVSVGDVGAVSCSPLQLTHLPAGGPLLPFALSLNLIAAIAWWWSRRASRKC